MMHPAIIALMVSSFITCLMLFGAGWFSARILLKWDLQSGSELQLLLEKRTYLIATVVAYALVFQILSLFLFIFTADVLHTRFVGAMCAAGSLNVNRFGYPTLVFKIINCLLAGVWLIINRADNQGFDYPLIRVKYTLLIVMVPLVFVEVALQADYFRGMHADIITSCCSSLFSISARTVAGDIAALPAPLMQKAFFSAMAVTGISGAFFLRMKMGGYFFSLASCLTFPVAIASLISFICLYFYELPTHHCPFCILQKEYGYVGYALYLALLTGGVAGAGAGALMPFRDKPSLIKVIPAMQRTLAMITLASYGLFTLIVVCRMLSTSFRL